MLQLQGSWKAPGLAFRVSIFASIVRSLCKPSLGALMLLPSVRSRLVRHRWILLTRKGRRQTVAEGIGSSLEGSYRHNSDPKWMFFPNLSLRPDLIARPLSCVNSIRLNADRMRVLSVGCRTEAEVLSLATCGFRLENIAAVDLFSYSPLIAVGDATDLPYPDDSFSVVVLGWVLEFIPVPDRALSEALRVLRLGGILAIGAMYHPESLDIEGYNSDRGFAGRTWAPRSTSEVVDRVKGLSTYEVTPLFDSDIQSDDADKRGEIITILRVGCGPNV